MLSDSIRERRYAAAGRCAAVLAALLAALAVSLPAWAFHWPWHHHPAAAPGESVHALAIAVDGAPGATGSSTGTPTPAVPQSWDRNTLLVDLTHLAGEGGATLAPLPSYGWPVRLEFRVRPGAMASLEVQGAQRVVYWLPAQGAALTLKLDPGVYRPGTGNIRLRWSAAGGSAR